MVHISEISFCDKRGFNIKSNDTKKWILDNLQEKFGIKIIAKHYERFNPGMMNSINNNLNMICVRTNGNPYFLYLVKINFTNYCILIDKKIQQGYFYPRMILVHLHFDNILFENETIFDGEMVKNQDNTWTYLMNDVIVYNGSYLSNMNLVKRLHLCFDILEKYFRPSVNDVFNLIIKGYFKYDELDIMTNEYIPTRTYTCRGIYIKPLYLKFKDILFNFDDTLIQKVERKKFKDVKNFLTKDDTDMIENNNNKNKYITAHSPSTSDNEDKMSIKSSSSTASLSTLNINKITKFFAKKTSDPDVYELYETDNSTKLFGIACIPNMKSSKYMKKIFEDKNVATRVEIEFEYCERFKKYKPLIPE